MRLTNYIRDAFITAVMSDVPRVDYVEQAEKIARAEVDRQFKLLFPNVDTKNAKLMEWFDGGTVYMPGNFRGISCGARRNYYMLRDDAPQVWAQLTELSRLKDEQDLQRQSLQSKLNAVAYSCRTLKQLQDLLPEFKQYMIEDDTKPVAQYLPAVANVVADFTKAGWPKQEVKK